MVKICLDAGHIGKYNRSPVVPAYYESDMNWKLHLLLKKYLEAYGIEVVLTRKTQDESLGVIPRGKAAKGCDLFLSIHSNACDTESVDYPVVIVPISGKGDAIGQKLAECIGNVMGTQQKGKIWERKNGSLDWYGVIRGAVEVGVPGLILEHSFHTNTRAAKWLLNDSNLDRLAKAEAEVIAEHYGLKKSAEKPVDNSTIYRVQVGAYSVKANAEAMLVKLKAAGFDGFITSTTVSTEPVKKSIDELAQEVLQGKWGTGTDRANRLAAAGYDYSAVQKRVNELLKS